MGVARLQEHAKEINIALVERNKCKAQERTSAQASKVDRWGCAAKYSAACVDHALILRNRYPHKNADNTVSSQRLPLRSPQWGSRWARLDTSD